MKQEIGSLMYLYLEDLQPSNPITVSPFILSETAKAVQNAGNRNWLPIVVKQIGEDAYQVIGNSFTYAVAEEAGLEKVWCIIADDTDSTQTAAKLLAQEELPKVNLAVASLNDIQQGLEYLVNRPANRLIKVKPKIASQRIYNSPRRYWKANLEDVTKLMCGITKGKQLNIFKEVFYVTPEPLPDTITDPAILDLFTVSELKAMAKKRGLKGYSSKKRSQLIKMLVQVEG